MFSKTCKYAIRAILFLAIHTDEENKIGVEDIAKGLNVPKHFLAKILQQMTRYNLASSTKGRNGGFYLSNENKKSTLLPVIEVIDGPDTFSSCILGLPDCSGANPCTLHSQAVVQREAMLSILRNQNIKEMAHKINLEKFKI